MIFFIQMILHEEGQRVNPTTTGGEINLGLEGEDGECQGHSRTHPHRHQNLKIHRQIHKQFNSQIYIQIDKRNICRQKHQKDRQINRKWLTNLQRNESMTIIIDIFYRVPYNPCPTVVTDVMSQSSKVCGAPCSKAINCLSLAYFSN